MEVGKPSASDPSESLSASHILAAPALRHLLLRRGDGETCSTEAKSFCADNSLSLCVCVCVCVCVCE